MPEKPDVTPPQPMKNQGQMPSGNPPEIADVTPPQPMGSQGTPGGDITNKRDPRSNNHG